MMGLGKADTETMSLLEYEARLFHWNDAHGGDEAVELPDRSTVQRQLDLINSDPRLNA